MLKVSKRYFYIVDVFAEEKYAGNQLAVVRNAATLSDVEMQKVAGEMNYSETTFILSDGQRGGGYDVRVFTPKTEVPFAGHPVLGTAFIIQREIIQKPVEVVLLNLKIGQISVTPNYRDGEVDVLWMKQMQPSFGRILDFEQTSKVLSLDVKEIDHRFPVQEVSTGLPFLIVPLRTLDGLKRAKINKDRYFELIRNLEAKGILIFCPETRKRGNDLSVRAFGDYYGIPEDPATGSANGCLAAYLLKHCYFGEDALDLRVEQGYEIARPSLLFLKAEDKDGQIDVSVGGKVVMVAKGELV
jgi:trans-2,3-dihydro-3-hydroxyanthranilate isomerase